MSARYEVVVACACPGDPQIHDEYCPGSWEWGANPIATICLEAAMHHLWREPKSLHPGWHEVSTSAEWAMFGPVPILDEPEEEPEA